MKINEIENGIDKLKKSGKLPSDFVLVQWSDGISLGCSKEGYVVWDNIGAAYCIIQGVYSLNVVWDEEEDRPSIGRIPIYTRASEYDIEPLLWLWCGIFNHT